MTGPEARTLTDRAAPVNDAVTFQAFGVPRTLAELTMLKDEPLTAVGAIFTDFGKAMAMGLASANFGGFLS